MENPYLQYSRARRRPARAHAAAPSGGASSHRRITLALSGGNALGAYAAGAFESLVEADFPLDVVSGASVGAINGAIIAGNRPELRVRKLREFWQQAASGSPFGWTPPAGPARDFFNKAHALQTIVMGRPGLFMPRPTGFMALLPGAPSDIGLFDPTPIVATLEKLIDFELLNQAVLPLIVSTVDLETGEAVHFDSREQRIGPPHLLASAAFVPGFPPVEIDGRVLGDPGMLCNLPFDPLLGTHPETDQLCFAIDLFDVRGDRPTSLDSGIERAQDIAFASQSWRTIDAYRREHRLRRLLAEVAAQREATQALDGPLAEAVRAEGRLSETEIVLLAYRPAAHEVGAKALEFSRASITERWAAGREDMARAIEKLQANEATSRDAGYAFYDARRTD